MSDLLEYRPVSGEDFIDREELVARMVKILRREGMPSQISITAPRRMGKTSVLLEVFRRLYQAPRDDAAIPIWIDVAALFREKGVQNFARAYCEAFAAGWLNYELRPTPPFDWREQGFFEQAVEQAQKEGLTGLLQPARQIELYLADGDLIPATAWAIRTPAHVGQAHGKNFVLFIDEVQDVLQVTQRYGADVLGQFRSSFEEAGNHVLYVLTGSAVRMMSYQIFSGDSPLFGRFHGESVGVLSPDYSRELAEKVAALHGLTWASEEAKEVVHTLCHGYPFYTIALLNHAARLPGGPTLDRERLENAFTAAMEREGDIYRELLYQTTTHLKQINEEQVSPQVLFRASRKEAVSVEEMNDLEGLNPHVVRDMFMADILEANATNTTVWIEDPVYRQWVRDVYGPLFVEEKPPGMVEERLRQSIGRLASDLGEQFEIRIQTLVWLFSGETLDGRCFGYPGQDLAPPPARKVWRRHQVHLERSDRTFEIDVLVDCERATRTWRTWPIECKYRERARDLSVALLTDLWEKWQEYHDQEEYTEVHPLWLCTWEPLPEDSAAWAREKGLWFSHEADLNELLQELTTRRRARKQVKSVGQ